MAHRPGKEILQTRRVFVVILALGLFAMAARNVVDPDVWWHLKTGQLTLANHAVFRTDPYSFTRAGQPWVNHEWLFDVLLFALYRAGGWGPLIVIFAGIIAASFMLVFLRCAGRPYIAGIVTLWAALASAPLWGVRPQMISLLLASAVLVLRDGAEANPRLWWWMVPMMLLWVNLHAEYALGIALLAAFLAGDALDAMFGFTTWPKAVPRLRRLAVVLLACVAVVPLNPYGLKMYSYPLATLRSTSMQRYIVEWFSPDFHKASYLPLLLFLLASLAAVALSGRFVDSGRSADGTKTRPGELLLLCAAIFAALLSVRHIPIYLLVAAPPLSAAMESWRLSRASGLRVQSQAAPAPGKSVLNAGLLAVCLCLAVLRVRDVISHQPQAESRSFPAGAVSFLRAHPPNGPTFNSYDWGGYFIWKLYPQQRVFIDGRADVYGDTFLEQYAHTLNATDNWREPLQRWQISTVVVPPDTPLLAALRANRSWKTVYADGRAVVVCRLP